MQKQAVLHKFLQNCFVFSLAILLWKGILLPVNFLFVFPKRKDGRI